MRIIISALFLLCSIVGLSQQSYLSNADSVAIALNTNGKYVQTLNYCDSVIKPKMGYYELYLAGTFAANALNKPLKAQSYLLLAEQDNPSDGYVLSLLLDNYLLTEQYPQAVRVENKLAALNMNQNLSPVHLVNAEVGIKHSNNDSLYDLLSFYQVCLGYKINRLVTYNAITNLNQQAYYGHINQWQFYTAFLWPLKNNLNLIGGVHLLDVSIKNIPAEAVNVFQKENPWAISLGFSKSKTNVTCQANAVYSYMNSENQLQLQTQFSIKPFFNDKLLFKTGVNYLAERSKFQATIDVAYKPISNFTLSVNYSYLNTKNFTEQQAYLVNNSFDLTRQRYQAIVGYNINKTWSIYAFYQLENKIEDYYKINYQLNMLLGGIKKTF